MYKWMDGSRTRVDQFKSRDDVQRGVFVLNACVSFPQLRLVVVLFQGVLHLSVDFINSFPLFAVALRLTRPHRLAGASHFITLLSPTDGNDLFTNPGGSPLLSRGREVQGAV